MCHILKIWPEFFDAVNNNQLRGCSRRYDRPYMAGDVLELREYSNDTKEFTGRVCKRRISYVLIGGQFGIDPSYCVLSMEPLS